MRFFFLFFLSIFLVACINNNKAGKQQGLRPGAFYYDCQVWAAESDSDVHIMFQYRNADVVDSLLSRKDSGYALFDGAPMDRDSSRYNGTIYEAIQPLAGFAGPHTITFLDGQKKEHQETFRFAPFALAQELPERQKKEPFTIRLKNFPPEAQTIRLVMTDTSFTSRDVNEEMQVENGEINITKKQLANLVAGPVTLEIYSEDERPLKQTATEDGRVLLLYNLRRQFDLVN